MMVPELGDRKTQLRLNTGLLPLAALVFAAFYLLSNSRPWLVLALGFAFLWAVAYLWSRHLGSALQVDREVDLVWATAGDFIHEILRLANNSRFPATWVEVVDRSQMVSEPFNAVVSVPGRAARTRRLNHLCDRRGLYTLGPTLIRSGDPFGIFTVEIEDPRTNSVMITPPVVPLEEVRIPSGGWGGQEERRKGVLARSISDAGVRPYQPGDSLRQIHWRATAHHDELVVRELETSASGEWWLFVDLYAGIQAGEGQDSTLELAVVLAASLAVKGLADGNRVGLSLAGPELTWLAPSADPTQRWRILQNLAAAGAGDRPLVDLIGLVDARASRAATTIVITSDPNPAWVAAANERALGGAALSTLVDPLSFGGRHGLDDVAGALNRCGIAHVLFGRHTLETAYSAQPGGRKGADAGSADGRKFVRQGEAGWQTVG